VKLCISHLARVLRTRQRLARSKPAGFESPRNRRDALEGVEEIELPAPKRPVEAQEAVEGLLTELLGEDHLPAMTRTVECRGPHGPGRERPEAPGADLGSR
jgi:hypothetical protein